MKQKTIFTVAVLIFLNLSVICHAKIKTVIDHNSNGFESLEFKFKKVPQPSRNDSAARAKFTLIDGQRDRNGGRIEKLFDGKIPTSEDQPSQNFFFRAGTDGGRILVDLGDAIEIKQVNTYSWHPNTRGPQLYKLYAAYDADEGFNQKPGRETDPQTCGWKLIAGIDTRPKKGIGGGQYAVSIQDSEGNIGKYRYLLLDISTTENSGPFGNTFFSEIDILDIDTKTEPAVPANQPAGKIQRDVIDADNGKYQIIIDTTETPDLTEWVQKDLAPVVKVWYPRLVKMLPGEGYQAPEKVTITFSETMQGVAATGGNRISCAAAWFRSQLQGEAKGAVVHELVHVVQNYGIARRTNPNPSRNPGWLVEGIADYIRWFLYEPDKKGAEITPRNFSQARYDSSYRISANFINWVSETYDKDIVLTLNAAARMGKYNDDIWKINTGHTVRQLADQWKQAMEKKIAENAKNNGIKD